MPSNMLLRRRKTFLLTFQRLFFGGREATTGNASALRRLPNREPVLRLGLGRTLYTCRQGLGRTLSNDRLLLAAAMPVYAPILQTVTAVNFAFLRALNPHLKMDNKRDFTKEAKLLLNAILVITLISSNLSWTLPFHEGGFKGVALFLLSPREEIWLP